jgi:Zn-dependent peptidase ImmA (M78 family)/DNA-binding XRE family transcriptional regulator
MFYPSRLTTVRKRRGFTIRHLADLAKLTPRSITSFESGELAPSRPTLARLARVLAVPTPFFARGEVELPPVEAISFRGLKTMRATQREAARAAAGFADDLLECISGDFDLPKPAIPDLFGEDPEQAAETVRAEWELGERPIRNMVHLLESRGVRVFSLAEDCVEVDAFSYWQEGEPFVFLNTIKSAERSRFDAAHELGHLVLHRQGRLDPRREEFEANRFASSFLMPRSSVIAATERHFHTVSGLIDLKRNWNVSVAALNYRLHYVGMTSHYHYGLLSKQIAQLGFRVEEPHSIPREISQVWSKVFDSLRQEGRGMGMLSEQLCYRTEDLNALVFGLAMLSIDGTAPVRSSGAKRSSLHLNQPED